MATEQNIQMNRFNGVDWDKLYPITKKENVQGLPNSFLTQNEVQRMIDNSISMIAIPRILDAYPVGSLYISENSASPANLFGGTWLRITDARVIIAGQDSGTYSVGSVGGEESHAITEGEMPSHSHGTAQNAGTSNTFDANIIIGSATTQGVKRNKLNTLKEGGNQKMSLMQPWKAYYVWKRTA